MSIEITDKNFNEVVIKSDKPVLVDFWAEWCAPCRALSPTIDALSKEFNGRVVVGKINVDESPNITSEYGIRNIPTLLFFKQGKMIQKNIGSLPKSVIEQKLNALIE